MCDYKDILWFGLQTDTNLVEQAIKFGLFNIPSTSNHCVQYNLKFLGFQMTY